MRKLSPPKWYQSLTSEQRDVLLGLIVILVIAILYYFQWAYYLTGLDGSKVNIDRPGRYFWWANDSGTYRDTGEWLFGRSDNDTIGYRPWLYPLLIGLARTLFADKAESALWFSQFLMWLGSGIFIFLALQNGTKSSPVAMIGTGIFYSHPSPLILTFHGMTESLNFLVIAIFGWLLTTTQKNRFYWVLLAIGFATVTKPIYLVLVILLAGYTFIREKQAPRSKRIGLIALVLLPIWIQLVLSFAATGRPTISDIGGYTFKNYLVADVYMRVEGTEWRETTKLIENWDTRKQLTYLWNHQRETALTYRSHLIDSNLWTGSFFTLGEGNRTQEFALAMNAAAAYLHLLMAPLVIYYLLSSKYSDNKEIIGVAYVSFLVQFLTSGISTGQEDRLMITALPLWIVAYILVLSGMRATQTKLESSA